ncbi:hypothetical protein [Actinoplanes sp. NPDC051851]|uniref:hypothetical protein n=1 Tax=Actinoplanes sp. NPDC051851 TaxID=3154753 RepID=UPI00342BD4F9
MPSDDGATPAWLRDYGHIAADLTSHIADAAPTPDGASTHLTSTHITADVAAMEWFAARLAADVAADYAPRAEAVASTLLGRLPRPDDRFVELHLFLNAHERVQDTCRRNVRDFANGTSDLADAARAVSDRYREADAATRDRLRRGPDAG